MPEKAASPSLYQGNNISNDIQLWGWLSNPVCNSTSQKPEGPSAWVQNRRRVGGGESCLPSPAPEPQAARAALFMEKQTRGMALTGCFTLFPLQTPAIQYSIAFTSSGSLLERNNKFNAGVVKYILYGLSCSQSLRKRALFR